MTPPSFSLCSLSIQEVSLAVDFVWKQDRYQHHLYWVHQGAEGSTRRGEALLESIHDDLEAAWPKCPAIQQLHMEDHVQGKVLLGVGLAGTNHYSLVVESSGPGRLRFDWAVRTRGRAEYVGTHYACAQSIERRWGLQCLPQSGCQTVADSSLWRIEYEGSRLEGPSTLQWSYDFQLTSHS